ncbi:MAG: hypothetical protein GY861_20880 [bacterium]|nr:hypothetical protein [bacterium]
MNSKLMSQKGVYKHILSDAAIRSRKSRREFSKEWLSVGKPTDKAYGEFGIDNGNEGKYFPIFDPDSALSALYLLRKAHNLLDMRSIIERAEFQLYPDDMIGIPYFVNRSKVSPKFTDHLKNSILDCTTEELKNEFSTSVSKGDSYTVPCVRDALMYNWLWLKGMFKYDGKYKDLKGAPIIFSTLKPEKRKQILDLIPMICEDIYILADTFPDEYASHTLAIRLLCEEYLTPNSQ